MKPGDIIEPKIDFITSDSISVVGTIVEEITDINGNRQLVASKRHRRGISRGDFRVDPNDPDSDLDEAAFQAAVQESVDKILGNNPNQIAKIAALNQQLAEKNQIIAQQKARIAQLEAQLGAGNE